MEHSAPLAALPWLPIGVLFFLMAMELGAQLEVAGARRFMRGFLSSAPATKLAVLLMLISAVVHAALVPSHLAEDPLRAGLFGLDSLGLLALSMWAFLFGHWRPAAAAFLLAGIAAYVFYAVTAREQVDPVGVATKLVEVAALLMVVIRGPWFSVVTASGDGPSVEAESPVRIKRNLWR